MSIGAFMKKVFAHTPPFNHVAKLDDKDYEAHRHTAFKRIYNHGARLKPKPSFSNPIQLDLFNAD